MRRQTHQRSCAIDMGGFTLIEAMIAITIVTILLGLAVPSFRDSALPSQLRSVANDLVAAAQLARSEAIKRNAVVTLCVSADGATCGAGNWQQGWIVISGPTVLQIEPAAPTGYRVTPAGGSVALISFQPTGVGATPVIFTACRATPTAGSQERVISVSATGRASVQTTTNGICP